MALCVKCGKKLECPCGAPQPVGGAVAPCPIKKGAIWIHVLDDLGKNIEDAIGIKSGSQKPCKAGGLAVWDPLDEGDYDVDLGPLNAELLKTYDLPKDTAKKVKVAQGEITYVPYTIVRKAWLKVKVVSKDGTKLFEGATVSATGPQAVADKPTAASGIADLERVTSGKYKIKVKLKEADDKDWATTVDFTKATEDVDLAPAEEKEVTVIVEPKNIVTPKVELEYKLVLLDTKLYAKQSGETKIYPSPTYVQVSYSETNKDHPFAKGGTLECAPANVEVFTDGACTKKLTGKLTKEQLSADPPTKLYLRGTTAGKYKIKLNLEDPADRFIRLEKNPTEEQEMGVVKLEMKLHQQDIPQIKGASMQVDPDTDPVGTYHTNLKDKALPDQKLMTDDEKIGKGSKDDAATPGRLLHVQETNNNGRAKLICVKLDAAHLPAGTDDYDIVLNTGRGWAPEAGADAKKPEDFMGGGGDTAGSGGLDLYDAEWEGAKKSPVKIKISALKSADQTYYVEGTSATEKVCDIRLDMGMDRAEGGLAKTAKRNGDWARFTIVKIKEVVIDYTTPAGKATAWDTGNNRFYINFLADSAGRKVKLQAELTHKLKNVNLHFMLAPDKDNTLAANWVLDIPATWKWKDITKDVKHLDKADRKDFLHLSEKTNDQGKASKELTLSRFGGDKFRPAVYVDQDAHLAKYVHGHADLEKKKPTLCALTINVWRKFWYQLIEVSGVANPGVAGAVGQYDRIKCDMTAATAATKTLAEAQGWNAIYPRYMVKVAGGNANSLVVSDQNKNNFFGGTGPEGDKPIKVPILICDAQWDTGPDTSAVNSPYGAVGDRNVTTDRLVLNPPLQGGNLLVAGQVRYRHPGAGPGTWVEGAPINLTNADVSIDSARTNLKQVQVKMPAAVTAWAATHPGTEVKITGLSVRGAKGPYLGESFNKKVLAVYDPADPVDFQNTIAHEIGHGFGQTVRHGKQPTGVPDHPNQYISYDSDGVSTGSHCNKDTNKCVMYQSGPIAGSYNRYCDVCHHYMLVNDMSKYS